MTSVGLSVAGFHSVFSEALDAELNYQLPVKSSILRVDNVEFVPEKGKAEHTSGENVVWNLRADGFMRGNTLEVQFLARPTVALGVTGSFKDQPIDACLFEEVEILDGAENRLSYIRNYDGLAQIMYDLQSADKNGANNLIKLKNHLAPASEQMIKWKRYSCKLHCGCLNNEYAYPLSHAGMKVRIKLKSDKNALTTTEGTSPTYQVKECVIRADILKLDQSVINLFQQSYGEGGAGVRYHFQDWKSVAGGLKNSTLQNFRLSEDVSSLRTALVAFIKTNELDLYTQAKIDRTASTLKEYQFQHGDQNVPNQRVLVENSDSTILEAGVKSLVELERAMKDLSFNPRSYDFSSTSYSASGDSATDFLIGQQFDRSNSGVISGVKSKNVPLDMELYFNSDPTASVGVNLYAYLLHDKIYTLSVAGSNVES